MSKFVSVVLAVMGAFFLYAILNTEVKMRRSVAIGEEIFVGYQEVRVANEEGVRKPYATPFETPNLPFGAKCFMSWSEVPSKVIRVLPGSNLLMENAADHYLTLNGCPKGTQFVISKWDALNTDKQYREAKQEAARRDWREEKEKEQLRKLLSSK